MREAQEDFSAWAEKVLRNQASTQKEIDDAKTQARVAVIQHTAAFRALLMSMLDVIARSAEAYSKQTGRKITYDLPPLPEDPFAKTPYGWQGLVEFSKTISWQLYTQVSKFDGEDMFVLVLDDRKLHKSSQPDAFIVYGSPESEYWHTSTRGSTYGAIAGLKVESRQFADQIVLTNTAKKLMEAQTVLAYPH